MTNDADLKPAVLVLAALPEFLMGPLRILGRCHDFYREDESGRDSMIAEIGPKIRAIVMAGGSVVPISLLEKLPSLEIITVFGVGYDGVPIDWCRSHNIRVTNTPDVLTDDVADAAVSLVLMTSRQLVQANRFLHQGEWAKGGYPLAHSLRGKTAGIVGLGRIGKAIAYRLDSMGMKIAWTGRTQQDTPWTFVPELLTLAAESDFLIVSCPGGAATRHLISAEVLVALGAQGTVINISRGSVVDESALITALQSNVIRGAGLDVFADEPNVPEALLACTNAVLLPHVGSGTFETRGAMAQLCIDNLNAHLAGLALVTPVV
jgi:hydroxypyruvate reductase